jgi:riboflavin synthase
MFTGIVTNLANIENLTKNQDQDLLIRLSLLSKEITDRNLEIGCSVSCNGVCLTLIKKEEQGDLLFLDFQASKESILKTNIKYWQINDKINIEFALRAGDELGGHLVSGHIDDIVKIKSIEKIDESLCFSFEISENMRKFICQKGSVVLNGVSLTINDVFADYFTVNIIDHTFNNSNFAFLKVGDVINIEFDQIIRYLNNLNLFK